MKKSVLRFTESKHVGKPLELLIFKELADVHELAASNKQLAAALDVLAARATPMRVAMKCENGCGTKAACLLMDRPDWGQRSWGVDRSTIACARCGKEFRRLTREPDGPFEFQVEELSLRGALRFCHSEPTKKQRNQFGRLLAQAFGISRLTEKVALEFFHAEQA